MRVALYLRVSTGEQTTTNQRLELERWAAARGFSIVGVYEDCGISGAKGREKRPQFDRMLKDAARRKFDMLAAWSVDRLGRSMQHLVTTLDELHELGVSLFLHQQALDTTTPSGEAMFGMLAVFSQFERRMIIARVNAGMERAREKGTKSGRAIGRPAHTPDTLDSVREALRLGRSVRVVHRATGASIGTVARERKTLVAAGVLPAVAA